MSTGTTAVDVIDVENIAELRVTPGTNRIKAAIVNSLTTLGDQRGGTFYWAPNSTEADDGDITIAPQQTPLGRFLVSSLTISGTGRVTGQFVYDTLSGLWTQIGARSPLLV